NVNLISLFKRRETNHSDLSFNVDWILVLHGGNGYTSINNFYRCTCACHKIGLLRSSAKPRLAQRAGREQHYSILIQITSGSTCIVLITLFVNDKLNADLV